MKEDWLRYNPLNMPESDYSVSEFIQNGEGTKITLNDDTKSITVFFDGVTPLVRTSVEGIRMRTWGEVQQKYNDKFFFRGWFLYKVENSGFSNWAAEESCGFYRAEKLKHFCIVTGEDIIDILSGVEPSIIMNNLAGKDTE